MGLSLRQALLQSSSFDCSSRKFVNGARSIILEDGWPAGRTPMPACAGLPIATEQVCSLRVQACKARRLQASQSRLGQACRSRVQACQSRVQACHSRQLQASQSRLQQACQSRLQACWSRQLQACESRMQACLLRQQLPANRESSRPASGEWRPAEGGPVAGEGGLRVEIVGSPKEISSVRPAAIIL